MRSRYTAFVVGDEAYILETWDPDTRPDSATSPPDSSWRGLVVMASDRGAHKDISGTVTFAARYHDGMEERVLIEKSSFRRLAGRWVYVDGDAHIA